MKYSLRKNSDSLSMGTQFNMQSQIKTAAIKDPTELFTKLLEFIMDRVHTEYPTVDELYKDIDQKFETVMNVMKQNYERWKKEEAPRLFESAGVELMDNVKDKASFEINDADLQGHPGNEEGDEDNGPDINENFFEDDNEDQNPHVNPEEDKHGRGVREEKENLLK